MVTVKYGKLTVSKFKSGEIQVSYIPPKLPYREVITLKDYSSDDLVVLLQLGCFLDDVALYMPYMPFGRKDWELAEEAKALSTFCDFINDLGYVKDIVTFHDHSPVTHALLSYHSEISPEPFFLDSLGIFKVDLDKAIFVSPDIGGVKTIKKFLAGTTQEKEIVCYSKTRVGQEVTTSMYIPANTSYCLTRPVVVIDDIVDGGRTHIAVAEDLIKRGLDSENLYLIVSHGFFFFDCYPKLRDLYRGGIATTNSVTSNATPDFVYNIEEYHAL